MATCYDCIHCEACSDAGDLGFSSLKEDVSKCKHFKNKADVAEVKHGEWVDNGIQDSMLSECSLCGFPCGAYTFNYCPNCGAKMSVNYKSSKNER